MVGSTATCMSRCVDDAKSLRLPSFSLPNFLPLISSMS